MNPFGRSLALGYDGSGCVSAITLPSGATLGYGYDARNNLSSVRFVVNSVRQYVYENASFPNALTGVIDESGNDSAPTVYQVRCSPTGLNAATAFSEPNDWRRKGWETSSFQCQSPSPWTHRGALECRCFGGEIAKLSSGRGHL